MSTELTPNHLVNVDEEVEAAVLSSVLNTPELAGTMLKYIRKSGVFYASNHRHIYEAIADLYLKAEPIDLTTVNRWLRENKVDEAVNIYFLMDMSSRAYLTMIERHCLILFQLAVKRFLGQYGGELRRASMDPTTDPLKLLGKVDSDIDDILGNIASMRERTANDYIREVFKDLEDKQAGRKKGLTFGIPMLDDRVGGFAPGNYIVLAAGTGMGKTGVMIHAIRHQVLDEGNPVGVVTLEMTGAEYMTRMFAAESDYSNSQLNRATVNIETLHERTARLIDMHLYIHDKPVESVELQFIIREWVRRKKVKMVVVDYIQLVRDARYTSRADRVSNLSMDLKSLAQELGVVIVVLSQLNREYERRKDFDKRPMLSDLKETSQLEQDGNAVIFLFRPYRYNLQYEDGSADVNTMEIHGLKFRGAQPTERNDPWLVDYDGACNRLATFGSLRHKIYRPTEGFSGVEGNKDMPF